MLTTKYKPSVRLMDTTLRDGEQTPDVAFSAEEKLAIARLLLVQVCVDRIEICSALVSPAEQRAAERIALWARQEDRLSQIEALGYADGERSVQWVKAAGVARMNLLVKGSERHCRLQLGLSLAEHVCQVRRTLGAAERAQLEISGAYLEDWSRGMHESPAYVGALVEALSGLGVRRLYLADTLGVLGPDLVLRYVRRMRRDFPSLSVELRAHNDYGLATANCLAAVRAGAEGLHTTVNGLGERAGNACLAQVAVALHDHAGRATGVDEARLPELSEAVAAASGYQVGHNEPIVGSNVFTQTAGIHADGDSKAGLYHSRLAAERFARRRQYALGKLSGRASLAIHLAELGVSLTPDQHAELRQYVVALGESKQRVRRTDLQRWLDPAVLR